MAAGYQPNYSAAPILEQSGAPRANAGGLSRLLTTKEVAHWLGCSDERVRQMAQAGLIAHVRYGTGPYRFREAHVHDFLERHTCPAQDNPRVCAASQGDRTGISATAAQLDQPALRIRRRQNAF